MSLSPPCKRRRATPPPNLLSLPDDLLHQIFHHLQPSSILRGRKLTTPPPSFPLAQTCTHLLHIFRTHPHLHTLDSLYPASLSSQTASLSHPHLPAHLASLLRLLPCLHAVHLSQPGLLSHIRGSSLRKLSFVDDGLLSHDVSFRLFQQHAELHEVQICNPASHTLHALRCVKNLNHLTLREVSAARLPDVKKLLLVRSRRLLSLCIACNASQFADLQEKSQREDLQNENPYVEFMKFLKQNMSALFPCLFVLTVRLGGVRHFENELDHAWFQQLSAYVQVEIESRNGTLKIPFGSAQHFSYVRTLNLGTIFTGPGTYRIGDPDCIDISSPSFVSLYANGDSGVREPVKQFIKTVTKHYQDNRLRLMAHFPILSVTSARETCKCVGDVLRMTKSLIRLEISRQIVGFVGNEGACAQMMCRFGSLQVLYLSSFEALLKTDASLPGVMLLREICNKQFVRGLPAFLGLLEANAKQLQCVYLEAAGDLVDKKEVGMGDCIARALASLDNFERALPFVDVCTLRGQLLTWKLQLV